MKGGVLICPGCKREAKYLSHTFAEIVEVGEVQNEEVEVLRRKEIFNGDKYFHECGTSFRPAGENSLFVPSLPKIQLGEQADTEAYTY